MPNPCVASPRSQTAYPPQAGLPAQRSFYFPRLPVSLVGVFRPHKQWLCAGFVPLHGCGPAPVLYRTSQLSQSGTRGVYHHTMGPEMQPNKTLAFLETVAALLIEYSFNPVEMKTCLTDILQEPAERPEDSSARRDAG